MAALSNVTNTLAVYGSQEEFLEVSLTEKSGKTSASIIRQSRVAGSASTLLNGPSLGATRKVAADSLATLQATKNSEQPIQKPVTKKSDLQAPELNKADTKQEEPSPLDVIRKANPVDVLKGLWNCSTPASFFDNFPDREERLQKIADEAWADKLQILRDLIERPRVDYFAGRCIKTDLSTEPLDLSSYTQYCVPELSRDEVIEKCVLPAITNKE